MGSQAETLSTKIPMKPLLSWLTHPPTGGLKSALLLRLMLGESCFGEAILEFVCTNQGIGGFSKWGIPLPPFTANFAACLEISGGLRLMSGLRTRLIASSFVVEMIVAILSPKISLHLGTSPLPRPPAPSKIGMWAARHIAGFSPA